MATFVKLTEWTDGEVLDDHIWVNMDTVIAMKVVEFTDGEHIYTMLVISPERITVAKARDDYSIDIVETPEQIMALLAPATPALGVADSDKE